MTTRAVLKSQNCRNDTGVTRAAVGGQSWWWWSAKQDSSPWCRLGHTERASLHVVCTCTPAFDWKLSLVVLRRKHHLIYLNSGWFRTVLYKYILSTTEHVAQAGCSSSCRRGEDSSPWATARHVTSTNTRLLRFITFKLLWKLILQIGGPRQIETL